MNTKPISKTQLQADIRALSDLLETANTGSDQFDIAARFVNEHPHLMAQRAWYPKGHFDVAMTGAPFLNMAAHAGNLACVKALVEAGAPLESRAPDGRTPLLHAITVRASARDKSLSPERRQIYEFLIAKGARADVVDNSGQSPIYQLFGDLDLDIAQDLIRRGTPLQGSFSKDGSGQLVSSIAALASYCAWCKPGSNRFQTLELLIRSGIDLNPPLREIGEHPLAKTLYQGGFEIADLMVEHGAQWRVRAPDGQSLMFAVGRATAVRWLLDKDPVLLDQPDHRGRTPLMHHLPNAIEVLPDHQDPDLGVVSTLILAGANLDAVDDQGPLFCLTPRQLIASGNNRSLQEFLRSCEASRAADEALKNIDPSQGVRP